MFQSSAVSTLSHPVADTMDMLQPWMIAAIVGLILLMLIIAGLARRKSRANDEDVMNISRGEERFVPAQTARKSQSERQGTRSARGEESLGSDDRATRKLASEQPTGKVAPAALRERDDSLDEREKERSRRSESDEDGEDSKSRRTQATEKSQSSQMSRDEIVKRAAERKKNRGKSKGSHAK